MPVDWPLAAQAADHPVDPKRSRSGRSRLPVARADFFLDEERRLSDEERSLMGGMLRGLVGQIADELLSGLPALLAAQAEPGRRYRSVWLWSQTPTRVDELRFWSGGK